MNLRILVALCCAATPAALHAQHSFSEGGSYDASVPTPQSVLGYQIGERFTPHHMIMRYLDRLAATTRRVKVDTVSHTFEGRDVVLVIVTRDANQARPPQSPADHAPPRTAAAAG